MKKELILKSTINISQTYSFNEYAPHNKSTTLFYYTT